MKYYTVKQMAEICQVHLKTVYLWIKSGRIHAEQMGKGCKLRIPETEIPAYLRKEKQV